MTEDKKKLPKITFKKIQKSDLPIYRVDQNTFYAQSSALDEYGKHQYYFVYKSEKVGWTCDCMYFTMNLTDTGSKECKHIKACKLL